MSFAPESPTISLSEWLNDSSIEPATRRERRYAISRFERVTRRDTQQVLDDINAGKISVYATSKHFVEQLREKVAPTTVCVQRSIIAGMFLQCLGEAKFSRSIFNRLIPNGSGYNSREKKVPSVDGLRLMLQAATPRYRALLGLFACSGMRVGECLSRKMTDFEVRPQGHARIKLLAKDTKARVSRYTFATREVMDWIKVGRLGFETNEYAFPSGFKGHVCYPIVQREIKRLFALVGLNDTPDKSEVYVIHSWRSFADTQMGRAGLDRKWIELIISHKNALAASGAYKDWDVIEQEWFERCEPKFTWLSKRRGKEGS